MFGTDILLMSRPVARGQVDMFPKKTSEFVLKFYCYEKVKHTRGIYARKSTMLHLIPLR